MSYYCLLFLCDASSLRQFLLATILYGDTMSPSVGIIAKRMFHTDQPSLQPSPPHSYIGTLVIVLVIAIIQWARRALLIQWARRPLFHSHPSYLILEQSSSMQAIVFTTASRLELAATLALTIICPRQSLPTSPHYWINSMSTPTTISLSSIVSDPGAIFVNASDSVHYRQSSGASCHARTDNYLSSSSNPHVGTPLCFYQ